MYLFTTHTVVPRDSVGYILRNRSPSVPFQGPLGGLKTETQIAPKYLSPFNEVFNRPNYINWLKLNFEQDEPGDLPGRRKAIY